MEGISSGKGKEEIPATFYQWFSQIEFEARRKEDPTILQWIQEKARWRQLSLKTQTVCW